MGPEVDCFSFDQINSARFVLFEFNFYSSSLNSFEIRVLDQDSELLIRHILIKISFIFFPICWSLAQC